MDSFFDDETEIVFDIRRPATQGHRVLPLMLEETKLDEADKKLIRQDRLQQVDDPLLRELMREMKGDEFDREFADYLQNQK